MTTNRTHAHARAVDGDNRVNVAVTIHPFGTIRHPDQRLSCATMSSDRDGSHCHRSTTRRTVTP